MIDTEIEKCRVTGLLGHLQAYPNDPDFLELQRRSLSDELA